MTELYMFIRKRKKEIGENILLLPCMIFQEMKRLSWDFDLSHLKKNMIKNSENQYKII
jgi:hypothetical protein